MELWVRSQKKKLLIQVKEVRAEVFVGKKLCSPNTNEEIISFDGDDKFYLIRVNSEIVGEYETEERCLEILDEIQNEIKKASCDYIIWHADGLFALGESDMHELNSQLQKYGTISVPKDVNAEFVPKGSQVVVYQMPEK